MINWNLRPIDPELDFATLAEWFTYLENSVNTEDGLKNYYEREKGRIIHLGATDANGNLAGFYWVERDKLVADRCLVSMYVVPELRLQGLGRRLYAEMLEAIRQTGVKTLQSNVRDDDVEGLEFFALRGFQPISHHIAMALDLTTFDDRPYAALVERLEAEGFIFTSMDELGNTEAAQRKLYALNDMAAAETMGSRGEHPWDSFADFQQRVCQTEWYIPAGQLVVIDSASGDWAAMSAITRFAGADYAYNLFTGVDRRYRGRKLAQAVKGRALCFAKDVLKVASVHTHHNSKNLPMLAIDRKLGYVPIPGYYLMEMKVMD